jgi:hypothetical protein
MENKVVGFIPKLLFRVFLALKEKFDPKQPVPDDEKITFEICYKLLENVDSKLTLAPISNKRFIKNEEKDMFIVLHEHSVKLINHIYSYSVYISNTQLYTQLVDKFDKVLDAERLKLETEINNNIHHSLAEILKKLD